MKQLFIMFLTFSIALYLVRENNVKDAAIANIQVENSVPVKLFPQAEFVSNQFGYGGIEMVCLKEINRIMTEVSADMNMRAGMAKSWLTIVNEASLSEK